MRLFVNLAHNSETSPGWLPDHCMNRGDAMKGLAMAMLSDLNGVVIPQAKREIDLKSGTYWRLNLQPPGTSKTTS